VELDINLPEPPLPAANYTSFVVSGNMVFVSGQLPLIDGQIRFQGCLGKNVSANDGYQAARLCGINIIAQTRAACGGSLDRVHKIVKLGGFVSCKPTFRDHPQIINGASDLMVEVFGKAIGQHARSAVGVPSLPFDAAVEIDAIVEISSEPAIKNLRKMSK
tara:strand:- start:111 stop:593 length:483 start_codon:yes stop_codon:yes gene_type:complete